MYNIIDFQLMGGLSEHKNGSPGGHGFIKIQRNLLSIKPQSFLSST
jgi:hypothetical protein